MVGKMVRAMLGAGRTVKKMGEAYTQIRTVKSTNKNGKAVVDAPSTTQQLERDMGPGMTAEILKGSSCQAGPHF